jgi:membrane-associated protease RseP (regulator of RpoE activity)
VSAIAGPSHDPRDSSSSPRSQTVERFEWSTSKGRLGVVVMGLTPELRTHFGAPGDRGVLVAHVDPGTPAAKAGIAVGDVIVQVRGQTIDSAADVLAAVEELGKGAHVEVTILRDRASRSLDVKLTNEAASASSSSTWFHRWMKAFETDPFATPLDEPAWLRGWPFDPPKTDPDPATASNWLRKLRDLFEAKRSGPTGRRS